MINLQSQNLIRSNPKPFSIDMADQLANEGRRLFDHFQGFDQSDVDLNRAKGQVQVDVKTPIGINHACAQFSGDRYTGTLEINNDERQTSLDRKYEFDDKAGTVTITQERPSYVNRKFDVYRIDEVHQKATVETIQVPREGFVA